MTMLKECRWAARKCGLPACKGERSAFAGCRYIFPGLALGAHLAKSGVVSDLMLTAASEALPQLIPEADRKRGQVYPPLKNIR